MRKTIKDPIDEPPNPRAGVLDRQLADLLARTGEREYAIRTASLFAKGGKYNPKKKRARYALT